MKLDSVEHIVWYAGWNKEVANSVGLVVIGRNEGHRLVAALSAIQKLPYRRVYVDSLSTDNSVAHALRLDAKVVVLDESQPLTAARARNVGVGALSDLEQAPDFIQFVDGDTVLADDWVGRACEHLSRNSRTAVVCGHLRERFAEQSIFHRLCDMVWAGDVGNIQSCGGIFMVRREAFIQVGGFDAASIAGEEADLCRRLRGAGWSVERIDCNMGAHDAAIDNWAQWWRRSSRGGYCYAERALNLESSADAWPYLMRMISVLTWAVAVPLLLIVCLVLCLWSLLWCIGVAVISGLYGRLIFRAYSRQRRRCRNTNDSLLYASFCLLNKYPETCGVVRCFWERTFRLPSRWIHYKIS